MSSWGVKIFQRFQLNFWSRKRSFVDLSSISILTQVISINHRQFWWWWSRFENNILATNICISSQTRECFRFRFHWVFRARSAFLWRSHCGLFEREPLKTRSMTLLSIYIQPSDDRRVVVVTIIFFIVLRLHSKSSQLGGEWQVDIVRNACVQPYRQTPFPHTS